MAEITIDEEVLNKRITDAVAAATTAEAAKFGDYEVLKAQAAKLVELEKANESDSEKRIREAREAAEATIEPKVSSATQALRDGLLRAAIKAEAATLGFQHPEDVVDKLVSDKTIKVKADGIVEGVVDAVKKLSTDRPEWLSGSRPVGHAPGRPQGTQPIIVPGNSDPETARAIHLASQVEARKAALGLTGSTI